MVWWWWWWWSRGRARARELKEALRCAVRVRHIPGRMGRCRRRATTACPDLPGCCRQQRALRTGRLLATPAAAPPCPPRLTQPDSAAQPRPRAPPPPCTRTRRLVDALHLVHAGGEQGHQPQAVRQELVVQHRGVGLKLHKLDGNGGHLRMAAGPGTARVALGRPVMGTCPWRRGWAQRGWDRRGQWWAPSHYVRAGAARVVPQVGGGAEDREGGRSTSGGRCWRRAAVRSAQVPRATASMQRCFPIRER